MGEPTLDVPTQRLDRRQMKSAVLLAYAVLLGGCATGSTEVGHRYYVFKAGGREQLTARPCGNAVDPCNQSMQDARVTNDPADEEFWQFRGQVPRYAVIFAIPVPAGRNDADFNVIGSRDTCESVRAKMTGDTQPCKGPFYFRREK